MARGVCFCIADNVENAVDIDYDTVTFYVPETETDYFLEENDTEAVASLMDCLKAYGATIGEENGVSWFVVNEQVKRNYFFKQYEEFLHKARTLTIDEFALSDTYELMKLIDDPFSDGVYESGYGFRTLDNFIRNAEIGKKYFIKNAYYMH